MKIKYAAFVLAGLFCITARAQCDTMSQGGRDFEAWAQYSQPARFEFSEPSFEYVSASGFQEGLSASDRDPFGDEALNGLAPFRFGEHWIVFDRFRKWDGGSGGAAGDPSDPQPSVPASEPSSVALLGAGLIALFGTALARSSRGRREA